MVHISLRENIIAEPHPTQFPWELFEAHKNQKLFFLIFGPNLSTSICVLRKKNVTNVNQLGDDYS